MSNGPAPPLSDAQLAAVYSRAGFSGGALLTMVATALGESGGDPDILGDETLQTTKWGPSVGISQVRCLNADRGTGRTRDCDALVDPDFNAASAWEISSSGTKFTDWTVYTSGRWRSFLPRALAAIAGAPQAGSGTGAGGLPPGVDRLATGDGGLVGKIVEPLTSGLQRLAIFAVLLTGGVVLVLAGGWRSVGSSRSAT